MLTKKMRGWLAMAMFCSFGQVVACLAADQPVKTAEKRDTLLYVHTTPPGAKVLLDGKELGTSDDLFPVEPGVGTIIIELEGHKPVTKKVTIRAKGVTRLVLTLMPAAGAEKRPADSSASDGGNALELSQQGWQLWKDGQFNEAVAKFSAAVKLDPKDENAWNGLGWARFNSGSNWPEAEKAFKQAVALNPTQPGALNGLGQIYLAQKKYDLAETYLRKASPRASAAWYGLARLYLLQGKFEKAEKWAQMVVDSGQGDKVAERMLQAAKEKRLGDGLRLMIEPQAIVTGKGEAGSSKSAGNSAEELSQQGWRLFFQERRYPEAAAKFREVVKLAPNDANSWNALGWASLNAGNLAEAEKDLQRAVAMNPQHWGALNGLGQLYLTEKKYDLAETFLLKAAPKSPDAWYGLARLYLIQGKFPEAKKWAEKAVDSAQYGELQAAKQQTLAERMLQAAKKKQLGENLRRMIEPHPANATPADKSKVESAPTPTVPTNDYRSVDATILECQKILVKAPDNAEAHNKLGVALQASGRTDEAITHYRHALKIEPGSADAHFNLGTALADLGRFAEAMANYRKALELKPDDVGFQRTLAWLQATCPEPSLRNGAEALTLAQRANHLSGGKRPDVLDTLAAAYAEAGWSPEALATARKALQLAKQGNDPALADAIQSRITLYEAGKPYRQTKSPRHGVNTP